MSREKKTMLPDLNSGTWKLNLALLWLSQILVLAGFSALIPFVPLFMKDVILKGVDEGVLAIYVSIFQFFGSFGYMIGNPLWGSLSDRFGTKVMLLRGTFGGGILFPVMAYVGNVWIFIILRLFTALLAGTTSASQIMIARMTPDNRQGFAQGTLLTAFWGGSMLGNVIGGFVIHSYGYTAVFWVCGIMYLIAGFAILFVREEMPSALRSVHKESSFKELPAEEEKKKTSVPEKKKREKSLYRNVLPNFSMITWLMCILFFINAYLRMLEVPFIALRVESLVPKGEAAYWTGIVGVVVCGGSIISGVLAGYMSDRYRPTKIMPFVLLISAGFLVWQGLAKDLLSFGISRTIGFMIAGAFSAFLQKTIVSMTPKRRRGSVMGYSQSFGSAGTMTASIIGGWVVFGFGLTGVFFFAAISFVLLLPVICKIFSLAENIPFYKAHSSVVNNRKRKV